MNPDHGGSALAAFRSAGLRPSTTYRARPWRPYSRRDALDYAIADAARSLPIAVVANIVSQTDTLVQFRTAMAKSKRRRK